MAVDLLCEPHSSRIFLRDESRSWCIERVSHLTILILLRSQSCKQGLVAISLACLVDDFPIYQLAMDKAATVAVYRLIFDRQQPGMTTPEQRSSRMRCQCL